MRAVCFLLVLPMLGQALARSPSQQEAQTVSQQEAQTVSQQEAQTVMPTDLVPGRPTTRPLPSAPGLIDRMMAKAKTVIKLAESYLYREEETQQKLDGKGNPVATTRKVYEVVHLPGGRVRRLLEQDGRPLSTEEARKEEERLQADVKRHLEPRDRQAGTTHKGREFQITAEDILAVSEFGPVTRTEYKGRRVLALSFRPRKGASSSGLGQRLVGKVEGRLLVDEETEQVVKAEGRLLDSFWVGGGLVGAVLPPTTFVFEQAQVAENLWMPVEGTVTLHARITFVPVRWHISSRFGGFRRFVVGEPSLGKPGRL